jgi:hypothetical protein
MTQIVLTPEQSALFRSADDAIVLLDAAGQPLGQISRGSSFVFSPSRIAAAKRRMHTESGGITTAELMKKLQSLGDASCDTP